MGINLRERTEKLKTDIPAVFLAMRHPKTPWYLKVLAAVAVAYALSPIDLIPDFIPVLGYLDDVLILSGLIALIIRKIPDDVMNECREQSIGMWKNGKPTKWYYAVPIVLIWMLVILWILKIVAA